MQWKVWCNAFEVPCLFSPVPFLSSALLIGALSRYGFANECGREISLVMVNNPISLLYGDPVRAAIRPRHSELGTKVLRLIGQAACCSRLSSGAFQLLYRRIAVPRNLDTDTLRRTQSGQ
jgi:hypothetical protein